MTLQLTSMFHNLSLHLRLPPRHGYMLHYLRTTTITHGLSYFGMEYNPSLTLQIVGGWYRRYVDKLTLAQLINSHQSHAKCRDAGMLSEESWLKIWISLCPHRNWYQNIYESWNVFTRDHFVEFLSSTPQLNGNILSVSEQVFIPAVSHMKIANVHVGTVHQKVRIALQFSYQFAIFISVCNFHVSLQFLRFVV